MDEEFGDCMYKMFGPTLLGYPVDVDASRLYMNMPQPDDPMKAVTLRSGMSMLTF